MPPPAPHIFSQAALKRGAYMYEQPTFFENNSDQPLAARLRPRTLSEFVGQKHLLGEGKVLRRLIEGDKIGSMIFWGPPGVGKTTLARIIANRTKASFIDFSAVTSGIKEIKQVMEQAEKGRRFGEKTILFGYFINFPLSPIPFGWR